ncbi:MAG: glutamate racemase [Oscillospiraceae bacterium]|nr:glutamate racemase [Oscillospiraceae bacterium]
MGSVGVFDSGLGGLTTVRAIHRLLPFQDIIYLGDTARVPYGNRGCEVIKRFASANARFLLGYKVETLVIACGTVSTVALDELRRLSPVPVLGVVEPACRQAVGATKNKRVGLIATKATAASRAYERTIAGLDADVEVFGNPCPLFVPLVENGRFRAGDAVIETVAAEYLAPLKAAGVDTLILGCTHYPLLKGIISDYMGEGVALIDAGEAVAAALAGSAVRAANENRGGGTTRYLVTDDEDKFGELAEIFLQNPTIGLVERVDIGEI